MGVALYSYSQSGPNHQDFQRLYILTEKVIPAVSSGFVDNALFTFTLDTPFRLEKGRLYFIGFRVFEYGGLASSG